MTLLEATIGTPWELDTKDSILVLEDRGMKPYQVDRVLMHLKQAGKFEGVRGIVLGDFPDSEPSVAGASYRTGSLRANSETAWRPGHFRRTSWAYRAAMLTIPLGIKARLDADGEGTLEFLERRWWLERNEARACNRNRRFGDGAAGRDATRTRLSRDWFGFWSLPAGVNAA